MRRLAIALGVLLASAVAAAEWHVERSGARRVQFTSSVTNLSFGGATDQVDGFVYWDGEGLLPPAAQVHVEVDLNSLDTGIGKRDRDMRELLDTRRFPRAIFRGSLLAQTDVDSVAGVLQVRVGGTLSLRGVERELVAPATIRLEPDRWHVRTEFSLRLSDYGIRAPSLAAFVKVSDQVQVQATFPMRPAVAGEETRR